MMDKLLNKKDNPF